MGKSAISMAIFHSYFDITRPGIPICQEFFGFRLQGSELQHLEAKASGRLGASAGAGNLSCLLGHLATSQLASIVVVTVVHISTRKYIESMLQLEPPLSSWGLFFRTNRYLRSSPNVFWHQAMIHSSKGMIWIVGWCWMHGTRWL